MKSRIRKSHFLLSSRARTISVAEIARMPDEKARAIFQRLRFSVNGGEPYCPKCGSISVYSLKSRRLWLCRECKKQFSVTSGTVFAGAKLPLRDYLLAIFLFANAHKGMSAIQLSRDMNIQYKTAYIICQKIRGAIEAEQKKIKLSGTVEVDGAFFGGHWDVENSTRDGRVRRVRIPKKAERRVVTVMRQRGGRTITTVGKSEWSAIPAIRHHVAPGTLIQADGSRAWDGLDAAFDMMRIEHADAYSFEGACTNQAESFFSRLRRAHMQHHRISGEYLGLYAAETAWREDHRRLSSGEQWLALVAMCLHTDKSAFIGYWQRRATEPRAANAATLIGGRPKLVSMESYARFDDRRGLIDDERSLELASMPEGEDAVFRKEVLSFARYVKASEPTISQIQLVQRVREFVAKEMAA